MINKNEKKRDKRNNKVKRKKEIFLCIVPMWNWNGHIIFNWSEWNDDRIQENDIWGEFEMFTRNA